MTETDVAPDESVPDDPAPLDARAAAAAKARRQLIEWMIVVAVAISAALLVRMFIVQQFQVEGQSMMTTLHDGDRVLVDKLTYRLHDPRRGDVIVLESDAVDLNHEDLIKRVVGLPGETIEIRDCTIYIDGVVLAEPYLDPAVIAQDGCGGDQEKLSIPAGDVFVLGDHRGNSRDSRSLGPIR
ncbi:MAG: signal peptidase, partial [Ilumatobacteraceae bacterium]|nr:signal peptidase [Ilumatobacteraceae bacterium]